MRFEQKDLRDAKPWVCVSIGHAAVPATARGADPRLGSAVTCVVTRFNARAPPSDGGSVAKVIALKINRRPGSRRCDTNLGCFAGALASRSALRTRPSVDTVGFLAPRSN